MNQYVLGNLKTYMTKMNAHTFILFRTNERDDRVAIHQFAIPFSVPPDQYPTLIGTYLKKYYQDHGYICDLIGGDFLDSDPETKKIMGLLEVYDRGSKMYHAKRVGQPWNDLLMQTIFDLMTPEQVFTLLTTYWGDYCILELFKVDDNPVLLGGD